MKRRWLAPEAVQTSAMDCGPAALKSLLEGHGIRASYGRLREACQTDVDGTSIDTIEQAAQALGLNATQVMLPPEHVLLPEAGALPALVVVQTPGGDTHFEIVWRVSFGLVQIMDPASGRRWSSTGEVQRLLYRHTQQVPSEAWREWAGTEPFLKPLARRLRACGAGDPQALIRKGLEDLGWRGLGALDAAARLTETMQLGRDGGAFVTGLVENPESIPESAWGVRADPASEESLLITGAVLLQVDGVKESAGSVEEAAKMSPELAAALREKPARPLLELWRTLRQGGSGSAWLAGAAMMLAAAGAVFEALLMRGLLDLGRVLVTQGERLAAMVAVISIPAVLLLLETSAYSSLLRVGRQLECRLRTRLLHKIPRLADRYLQSRPVSDMCERSQSVWKVRQMPEVAGRLLEILFQIAFTLVGIALLYPASAMAAMVAALATVGLPLALMPAIIERDMKLRTHAGALSRFTFDALAGATPIRAHRAGASIRGQQLEMLREWYKAGIAEQNLVAWTEGGKYLLGAMMAAWLVMREAAGTSDPAGLLLLTYWALEIPQMGLQAGTLLWQYPQQRNAALRLLEPLGAEESDIGTPDGGQVPRGVEIQLHGVSVKAGGHEILREVTLEIPAGTHVGIVGASGAGKSSLVGLLLGWHRVSDGSLKVDGKEMDTRVLADLRRQTAWVDPQVQLWNRSLAGNLHYGNAPDAAGRMAYALENADLYSVLERMPDGLQSVIGEGGGLVSGGEGQRVRIGRAMLRKEVRLAILDEPARGLSRGARHEMVARMRREWRRATLLCITHDVTDTREFPRVLVVDAGQVVEDGDPAKLAADPDSRYARLLEAEQRVRRLVWGSEIWRRLRLAGGSLHDDAA